MSSECTVLPYGPIPPGFRCSKLEDLCMSESGIQTGPFGSQLHQEDYVPIGTPIITVEHLGDNRINSNSRDIPMVSDTDLNRLARYTLQEGDIVFSRVGSVDRSALVRREEAGWLFSGRCLRVRPNINLIDPDYLSWFFGLSIFKEYIRQIAVGATMPSLNTKLLSEVPIYYPTLPEQRSIARVIGSLDDKIEINRKINETLEAIISKIFNSWFIDFDPVRSKISGLQYICSSDYIADLFPDSFEDSCIGEIPHGWKVRPIGEMVKVVGGGTPSTEETAFWEEGTHPFCTPKDMASLTSPVLLDTERYLTDDGVAKISSGQLPIGTVLLSSRAPIGYLAITEIPVSINQGIIAMVCDGELPNIYTLYWSQANIENFISNANGSTFLEISKKNFRPLNVLVPPSQILNQFCQIAGPLYRQLVNNLMQEPILKSIRNSILPRLISGEIWISQ